MISRLISKFFDKSEKPKNDFSDFFRHASTKEKKKLFKQVVSRANDDQRKLVEKANRLDQEPA